jgi:ATP-dependent exoDNAse (exonuclease V) beta subunit
MTIDSLCSSITHQLPLSSRLGANPSRVENASTLYLQAAQMTVSQCLASNQTEDDAIRTLLLHLNNKQALACESIANMLASREQWLGLIFSQQSHDMETLRYHLERSIADVVKDSFEKIMSSLWSVDWDGVALYLNYAASNMESQYHQEIMREWIGLSCDVSDLEKWRALSQWLCTTEGALRKTVDKRQGFPAASSIKDKEHATRAKLMKDGFIAWLDHVREDEQAVGALKDLISLPDPVYADQQWNVLKALFTVLPKAVEQLYLLFESRGETDFSAVSRCALTALGGENDPTDLDLKFDDALHHILVDEFQDTSLTQFELVRRLVAHWENDGEKTLFLVGDPMQSIYRFRQAEVGGFLQAQQFGISPIQLKSLSLRSNFRSEKPIIDWINEHMPRTFAVEEDIYLGAITYAPFDAQLPAGSDSGVFLKWIEGSEGLCESFIHTLNALEADDNIKSIAILVRNRGHVEAILPALRKANIAYQAVEIEKITQTSCVRQLLQLTRAYLNRADTQAWLAVLMSPYLGLSLADLTCLREHATLYIDAIATWESVPGISETGRAILTRVSPVLTDWILQKNRLPLAQAVEGAWLALGGPASLPGIQHLADAQAFFDLLHACDEGGTIDLITFENRLDNLFSNASQSAKIQIMTIHKSKGLEFDAVLIPSLERQPKASEKPLLLWESCPIDQENVLLFAPIHEAQEDVDPIYEFMWKKHKIRERHENARLLYVALTRAKKQLHLFAEKKKPRQDSFLALLQGAFDAFSLAEADIASDAIPAQMIPLSYHLQRLDPHWKHPFLEQLLKAHHDAKIVKNNPIDHDMIIPDRYVDKTLGTLIHQILYLWAEQPFLLKQPIEQQLPCWKAMLLENGLSLTHLDWVKHVMQSVQADPRAQFILGPHSIADSEHEITIVQDGQVNTYVIDRTFVDQDNVRVIVDYKTGNPSHESQGLGRYREQLFSYARVMQTLESRSIRLCLYFPLTGDYREEMYSASEVIS